MGVGYQERDFEIIDYELVSVDGIPTPLRGPAPDSDGGALLVFVGAAQTFGCYTQTPFPRLVSDAIGVQGLNLGIAGAGPSRFEHLPGIDMWLSRANLVVVQVMSGRSESNSRLLSETGGEMLTDTVTGLTIGAAPAWAKVLHDEPEGVVRGLIAENRTNWLENYRRLAARIQVPSVLLWFASRPPEYARTYDTVANLFGEFPQFVDRSWLDDITPLFDRYVEVISDRGRPQRLISRFTGEETTITMREDLGGRTKRFNNYYPTPEMHVDAAIQLTPVVRELLAR